MTERHIRVVCVGKLKQTHQYLMSGITLYTQRCRPWVTLEWLEVPEQTQSKRDVASAQALEAAAIRKQCLPEAPMLALSEEGALLSTEALMAWLLNETPIKATGTHQKLPLLPAWTKLNVIIGGAFGVDDALKAECAQVLSLSPLTFPHTMVRLILSEQIYRVFSLHQGHAYHKE